MSIALVAGATIVYSKYNDFNTFKEHLNELGDDQIGDGREQLLYKHGTPDEVANDVTSEMVSVGPTEAARLNNYGVWKWTGKDGAIKKIGFDRSKNVAVWINCEDHVESFVAKCFTVGGTSTRLAPALREFNNEASITSGLGSPSNVFFDDSGGTRRKILEYPSMGLWLAFEHERLVMIEKNSDQPSFLWWLREGPAS